MRHSTRFDTSTNAGSAGSWRLSMLEGRAARPGLGLGICGEHGGDPASVRFCADHGLDYVSCSPPRVPVARLEAGRAAVLPRCPAPAPTPAEQTFPPRVNLHLSDPFVAYTQRVDSLAAYPPTVGRLAGTAATQRRRYGFRLQATAMTPRRHRRRPRGSRPVRPCLSLTPSVRISAARRFWSASSSRVMSQTGMRERTRWTHRLSRRTAARLW